MGRDKPPKAGQATDKPSIPFVILGPCLAAGAKRCRGVVQGGGLGDSARKTDCAVGSG